MILQHTTSLNHNLWEEQKIIQTQDHKNPFKLKSSRSLDQVQESRSSKSINKETIPITKENPVANFKPETKLTDKR